jgi:hypothetical protein
MRRSNSGMQRFLYIAGLVATSLLSVYVTAAQSSADKQASQSKGGTGWQL